ncbi:MAG: 16S rRNA processing protein RimM, partial [Deltaproteobacteria bacterium]|nr:16S rRNA processing protein RimM [Deltaproteobacteria bacterium]
GNRELTVKSLRPHKSVIIVKTVELKDRNEAEALVGSVVSVPRDVLGELPDGQYYGFEIIGNLIVEENGDEVGKVCDIISTGSNDVYVIERDRDGVREELLLPAIDEVLLEMDKENSVITVRIPDGLSFNPKTNK